jgi:ribosomal protein S7
MASNYCEVFFLVVMRYGKKYDSTKILNSSLILFEEKELQERYSVIVHSSTQNCEKKLPSLF